MGFELLQERHGGVLVLSPRGRLDNDNAAEFELAAQELINAGERHIVVDLAGLNYASNAGLRVLGKMGKALRTPTTSLRLCGLTPVLRQVFDQAGIASVFEIRPDRRHALADHPAAQGAGELGRAAARLLGVPDAASDADGADGANDTVRKLAPLAVELLATGIAAPRPRPMVDATQLAPKVRDSDVARALAAQAAAQPRLSWWQRLFGKGKTK
jgi:anti-sigma B factor antagonist